MDEVALGQVTHARTYLLTEVDELSYCQHL